MGQGRSSCAMASPRSAIAATTPQARRYAEASPRTVCETAPRERFPSAFPTSAPAPPRARHAASCRLASSRTRCASRSRSLAARARARLRRRLFSSTVFSRTRRTPCTRLLPPRNARRPARLGHPRRRRRPRRRRKSARTTRGFLKNARSLPPFPPRLRRTASVRAGHPRRPPRHLSAASRATRARSRSRREPSEGLRAPRTRLPPFRPRGGGGGAPRVLRATRGPFDRLLRELARRFERRLPQAGACRTNTSVPVTEKVRLGK